MSQHNTHRAAGRAVIRSTVARRALQGTGGAALFGAVLAGSALGATSAQAAPSSAPAPAASSPAVSAPAAPAPAAVLSSGATLRWGSTGARVSALQSGLNTHGAHLAVDGKFGPKTHAAVKNYQANKGLVVDGIVGPKTTAALNGTGSTGAAKSSGSSASTSSIVAAARAQVGVHYTWGGNSPSQGFDCSGLVQYAYKQAGISLPHQSGRIAAGGTRISQSQAQPGDIVVYPGHVAIYAGNGTIIDASGSRQQIVERAIWGSPTGFVTYR